jgi:FkbM family methyltransferase
VQPPIAPRQQNFFKRLFAKLLGQASAPGQASGLFHMRTELALLQSSVAKLNSAYGRRDVASVKALLASTNRRDFEAAVRDRVHTVPLPDATVLCRVLGRYKLYVDANDRSMAPHLMMEGYWQYWITAFLCRNLNRGETAYDLEAGYGYYSLLMSELVGDDGRVVALEYNPWLFQLLRRNIALNGRDGIVVIQRLVAASKAAAARELPAPLTGPATGINQAAQFRRSTTDTCVAPAMTLDGLEPGNTDLVRVSALGLELGALEGMTGVMDRSPSLRIILDFVASRCADPEATLKVLAQRFPLRFIDWDSQAKPITIEEILERGEATLFLSQAEPR